MSDTPVFCPNCGNKIAGNAKFCISCGHKLAPEAQQPVQSITHGKEKPKKNTVLVITLIVSAVIIIALGITLGIVLSNNDDSSGSHVSYEDDDDKDKQKDDDEDEDNQRDDDNYKDDTDNEEEDGRWGQSASDNNVSYGMENISIDNEECVGDAYYTYSEAYGHLFAFTYEEGNSGLMLTMVLPEKKCVSGKTFSKQDLTSSNCLAELIMVIDGQSQVINSNENADLFHSITFTLDKVSMYESARFTFEGEITSFGTRFELKGQAAAYYTEETNNTEGNSDSQSGGWDSQQGQTKEMCAVCHGTGECQICDGKGLASYTIGGEPVICTSCSGSCQCKYCWGTGYIWK